MTGAILRMADSLRTRWRLRGCTSLGAGVRAIGRVWVRGGGAIVIGNGVVFDARRAPIELHAAPGAEIRIGDGCLIRAGTSIEAQRSVQLGARVCLAEFCKIIDNHFHSVHGDRNARPPSEPVIVGDDAELGARAILLPGAHLEPGVRVGPATVVTRRVPAGASVSGQPPVIRKSVPPCP